MAEPQNTEAQTPKDDISTLQSQLRDLRQKQYTPGSGWDPKVDYPKLTEIEERLAGLKPQLTPDQTAALNRQSEAGIAGKAPLSPDEQKNIIDVSAAATATRSKE